jgi:DNA-binding CsgD family transcriptional regulator
MRSCDQVEIIESAYALGVPDAQWQYRLTDLVAERWGSAAASFLYDASRPTEVICERVVVRQAGERSIVDAPRSIPLCNPALRHALFRTRPHLAQLVELVGPERSDAADCERVLDVVRDLQPGPFSVVLRTLSHSHKGVFFVLQSRPIGERMRAMWGQVAVHVGLAYRLRCALANASGGADRNKPDPAVLRRALRQAADNVLVAGHRDPRHAGDAGGLTGRESQIARYLVQRPAEELIDYSHGLSTSAIAEHVATLARKFGVTLPVEIARLFGGSLDSTPEE